MPKVLATIDNGARSVTLDVDLNNQFDLSVEATDHPVEEGANITDHARAKPVEVKLTGFVSGSPLDGSDGPTRVALARATLEGLLGDRKTCTLTTEARVYTSMLPIALSITRNAAQGDGLEFTIGFKEIRIAKLRRKLVTVAKDGRGRNPKQETGKQPAVDESALTSLTGGTDSDGVTKASKAVTKWLKR